MPASLLILLDDGYSARGTLLDPLAAGAEPASFGSSDELRGLLGQAEPNTLLWIDAPAESLGPMLLKPALGNRMHTCAVRDGLYLLGAPYPADPANLGRAVAEAEAVLSEISDDLLAQLAMLVRENSQSGELGLFEAELARRFDVLSMPPTGEAEVKLFEPLLAGPIPPSRHDVPADVLENLFTARQALSSAFDDYEERPQQQAMAQAVAEALAANKQLVVEAGTGVGKSLAYLLPLALHSVRTGKLGLVSTNTLNLQQQLLDNDIPRLRRILDMFELRITLLKGREHYLCLKRLEDTWLRDTATARNARTQLLATDSGPGLLFMLRSLIQLSREPQGDLDVIGSPAGLSQARRQGLARSIDCGFHTCLGERCEHKPRCHFFKQREASVNSHITLTNHALVFSLFNPDAEESDTVVHRASAIVFDEAHNLESAITNQRTVVLHSGQPVELANELQGLLDNDSIRKRLRTEPDRVSETAKPLFNNLKHAITKFPRWVVHAAEVDQQIGKLVQQAAGRGHFDYAQPNQLTPAIANPAQLHVLELLEKLAQRLLVGLKGYFEIVAALHQLCSDENSGLYIDEPGLLMQLQSLYHRLFACVAAVDVWSPAAEHNICWFNADLSRAELSWGYSTAPLAVGSIYQALASSKETTVLCSATLTVAGKFDYLQQSLGYSEEAAALAQWLHLDSPFDYSRQSQLLIATDMDAPTGAGRDRYLVQLEDVIREVCGIFDKGVLVLFNSYRDLNHIAGQLEYGAHADRLLIQGQSGTRAELAERFRAGGDKVLLATRSFWEGFDVAGEALSCVVLTKLPFANFKDPIHAGRQLALDKAGRSSFADYSLPQAAMQLKQGFGRLIRRRADRGCVFILDSRVARARYGQVFLDSLPGPKTHAGTYQSCLEEARRFMEAETVELAVDAPLGAQPVLVPEPA